MIKDFEAINYRAPVRLDTRITTSLKLALEGYLLAIADEVALP